MRKLIKRWAGELARDEGVAGIVIAVIIAVVAFSALGVFFAQYNGPARELALLKSGGDGTSLLKDSLKVYWFQNEVIPCPDTTQDGVADMDPDTGQEDQCAGGTTGTISGTIPWKTLGLSRDQALDAYGRYYTYVVPAAPAVRAVCFSVANDYDSTQQEYTGSLVENEELEVRTSSQDEDSGEFVSYAIISHGENGYGAKLLSNETLDTNDDTGPDELTNAAANVASIVSGPYVSGAEGFDDSVIAPTRSDLTEMCAQMTPAGITNGTMGEDFTGTGTGFDTTKVVPNSTGPTRTDIGGDGVAQYSDNTDYLVTASGWDFAPSVRPVYVSAYWTPAAGASVGGLSIVTRATTSTLTTADTFTTGITFRFWSGTGAMGANTISVRDNGADVATSGTDNYTMTAGEEYLLEVYDNGDDVWARISQADDPTNSATVRSSAVAGNDLTGDQRVVFISGVNATSYLDDLLIGAPMLAAEFDGSASRAESTANTNMHTYSTRSLTIEAWINPDSYPVSDGDDDTIDAMVIAGKWNGDEDTLATAQGYRLYLNAGEVHLQLAGTTSTTPQIRTFDSGFSPTRGEWTHVAVTYDALTGAVQFFKNGDLAGAAVTDIVDVDGTGTGVGGVNNSTTLPFAVGADREGAGTAFADFFDGRISDVRVWQTARTVDQIQDCFMRRVPSNGCALDTPNDLVVNWRFDPKPSEGGISPGTTVVAARGTVGSSSGVTYGGVLAKYFRPFSTEFCPDADDIPGTTIPGTRVGAYQCEFRYPEQSTTTSGYVMVIPTNMPTLGLKAWGAGGGGYDSGTPVSAGGAGGFSEGLFETIGGTAVAGDQLEVIVGGGGTGSEDEDLGAGGGGASGVYRFANAARALVAGGGGGASYSINVASTCDDYEGLSSQCGTGGGGGGAGTAAAALTSRAPDATSPNVCGGRGGDNGPSGVDPDNGTYCDEGGGDATTSAGGGGSGLAGGSSGIGEGGDGYDGGSRMGGGGGGGGYPLGGEAGGYSPSFDSGYGGGGGSGDGNASAINFAGEASGVVTTSGGTCSGITSGTTDSSAVITNIDAPSTWYVGCEIDGDDMHPNAEIIAIDRTARTVTVDPDAQGPSTPEVITNLEASGAGDATISYELGGSDDPDYNPDHLDDYATLQAPGRGGISNDVHGRAGAVILKW